MSYDLNFWRQSADESRTPQAIYETFCAGEEVHGLVELPMSEMVAALIDAFPEAESGETGPSGRWFEGISGGGAMTIEWTRFFLRADCYGMTGDDMNKVIDVAHRFECPLYDPQVNERFDGSR